MRFSSIFLASGWEWSIAAQTPPPPSLYILVFLFHLILVAKNDFKLPSRLAAASIPGSILARDRKSFPKQFRVHALVFLGSWGEADLL